MGRAPRIDIGSEVYHVLNRANARVTIFKKEKDFEVFENILEEAKDRFFMRILSYQIMPNHWHLILYPKDDGDLSLFMHWLTLTHTQRWHVHYHLIGYGHLYQGRYKSFIIQKDEYLLQACKYVESNALRAKLVKRAQDWKWSSLWRREYGSNKEKGLLATWPVVMPNNYLKWINSPNTEKELEFIRGSISKNQPLGNQVWLDKVVKKFGLEMTLRRPGRPRNGT